MRSIVLLTAFLFCRTLALAQGDQTVYVDSLTSGWQNYGWATLDYANAAPVHGGAASIKVTAGANQALYLHHAAQDGSSFQSLTFWINGGTSGGQPLQLQATVNGGAQAAYALPAPLANAWQQITVPLTALGVASSAAFDGFWIQNRTGAAIPAFYVDDIALIATPAPSAIRLQVDAGHALRAIDGRLYGINTAVYDSRLGSAITASRLAGVVGALRFPGGSTADSYDWQTDRSVPDGGFQWASAFPTFAKLVETLGAQAYVSVNYGSGTPEQAAAWVAYANALPTNTTPIGVDGKGRDWHTAGYWAAIRASAPLSADDGFNVLRVNRPAPFAAHCWEIGNECYGGWENDTRPSAHDPYAYAQAFAQYRARMKAVDPTINVGAVASAGEDSYGNGQHAAPNASAGGALHSGWTPVVIYNLAQLGALPDSLIYHTYPQEPGAESDATLLQAPAGRVADAANLRAMLTGYGGAATSAVELVITEANSVTYNPGKQTVSLVDGLFCADTLGTLAETEFNACVWWDLRNGTDPSENNSSSLYGWRPFGDYGMFAQGDRSDTLADTPYPPYYAFKLLSHWAAPGDATLSAASNYSLLSVHAVRRSGGGLALLVVNKSPSAALTGHVELTGFVPSTATAAVYSYGINEDLASADLKTSTFTGAAGAFDYSFPAYSMTVLQLAPPAGAFAAWQGAAFTPVQLSNPAISGPNADPDHDGLSNLAEYVLVRNPLAPDSGGAFTSPSTTYPTLTFSRRKPLGNVTCVAESSSDLIDWHSGAAYTSEISLVDQGATERVTLQGQTPISAGSPQFLRLRMTLSP